MSWKAEARRIYESRVIDDALSKLTQHLDVASIPLTDSELRTLAKRSRESTHSERKKDRLARYKAYLCRRYDSQQIAQVVDALERVHNEIRWEEK